MRLAKTGVAKTAVANCVWQKLEWQKLRWQNVGGKLWMAKCEWRNEKWQNVDSGKLRVAKNSGGELKSGEMSGSHVRYGIDVLRKALVSKFLRIR